MFSLYHPSAWGIIGVVQQPKLMRKLIFLLLLAVQLVPCLGAQEKQRIAVIPFNPVNIAKDEAEIIYKDFETALAQTDAYVMIDREEIIRLLGDGEVGLFSCTTEACALDIAKNLAADQVIRGRLSRQISKYVLKVQLIDVSNGNILFLEEISEQFLSRMRGAVELLAYKFAGMAITQYGSVQIARQFTELFVGTVPSRADIYINGIKRGISPDLITGVPVGRITLSARYGNYYGEQTLTVTGDTGQVRIECREAYGALQIRCEQDLDVYLDDRWLGKVSAGPFRNLPIGIHKLELRGQGLYWQEEVVLQSDRQTLREARPTPYGRIEYGIPEGAVTEITGELFRQVVREYGVLQAPVGTYSAIVTGKNYETSEPFSITVSQDAEVSFAPELSFTEDYEYQLFQDQIAEAERSIQFGYRPTSRDVQELQELKKTITKSKHDFPNLLTRVDALIDKTETIFGGDAPSGVQEEESVAEKQQRLNSLLAQMQGLELDLESLSWKRRRRAIGGWTSFGFSMTSVGVAGVFYFLANDAYKNYLNLVYAGAPSAEKQEAYSITQKWRTATIAALGTSGAFLITSSIFWISRPSIRTVNDKLESLKQEIDALQKELQ